MQQIVLLLQLVLALMQASPNNAQVQALAVQAVNQATVALAQYQTPTQTDGSTVSFTVPTSTDQTQPIVINVTNPPTVNAPSVPVLGSAPDAPTSTPASCTVTAFQNTSTDYQFELQQAQVNKDAGKGFEYEGYAPPRIPQNIVTTIEWTLNGLPSSTIGTVYSIGSYVNSNGDMTQVGNDSDIYHLEYEDGFGPFSGQFKAEIPQYLPGGIHADFGNGVTCDYPIVN